MMTIMVYVYCPLNTAKLHPDDHYGICLLSIQWTVNIYRNGHHGFYLAVKIVSNILKKAQGRKFEKE